MASSAIPQTARSMSLVNTAVNLLSSGNYVIKGLYVFNSDSATRYVKLYNKQGAEGASDTPVLTLGVGSGLPASIGFEDGMFVVTAGLSARAVTEIGDTGVTPAAANTVICTLFYSSL